jgi:hypothetical protein
VETREFFGCASVFVRMLPCKLAGDRWELVIDVRRQYYRGVRVSVFKRGLPVTIFVAQLIASTLIGWTQTPQSLQYRIPKPDLRKYQAVQGARNWKNPYLIVRRDGIEIVGMTAVGQAIPVDSVPGVLKGLPDSAWPYGLVVAVQDIGIVSEGDPPRIEANRKRLLMLLKKLAIAVDLWPST